MYILLRVLRKKFRYGFSAKKYNEKKYIPSLCSKTVEMISPRVRAKRSAVSLLIENNLLYLIVISNCVLSTHFSGTVILSNTCKKL